MSAKGLGLKMLIISARPPPNLTDIRLTCSRERTKTRGLQRYYEDLLAGHAKCRRHFLQGVLRMSAHLLFDKISPALYIDKFCVRSFLFNPKDVKDFEQGDS